MTSPPEGRNWQSLAAVLVILSLCGCGQGDGLDLVPVQGQVTLGGAPLPDADVIFQPAIGRPSVGRTDAEGRYRLQYTSEKPGALSGRHKVLITTFVEPDSDSSDPERQAGRPERVPAQYNSRSTLEVEVDSGRKEPLDFTLEAQAEGPSGSGVAARAFSRP